MYVAVGMDVQLGKTGANFKPVCSAGFVHRLKFEVRAQGKWSHMNDSCWPRAVGGDVGQA